MHLDSKSLFNNMGAIHSLSRAPFVIHMLTYQTHRAHTPTPPACVTSWWARNLYLSSCISQGPIETRPGEKRTHTKNEERRDMARYGLEADLMTSPGQFDSGDDSGAGLQPHAGTNKSSYEDDNERWCYTAPLHPIISAGCPMPLCH